MCKVLIVDDEPIAVESIVYMIKKNLENIEIVGTARSGKDAIEKAYTLHPDVIIMDINMPGINGLDAIKQIRNVDSRVSFIVISAFEYFDYAVEAAAMGVRDYLLKPVKEDVFIEVLTRKADEAALQKADIIKQIEQREKLEMVIPVMETSFVNLLGLGGENTEELENYCNWLGYNTYSGYVIAIEVFGDFEENKFLTEDIFYRKIKKILQSLCCCIVGPLSFNRIIIYVFNNEKNKKQEQKTASLRMAKSILDKIPADYPEVFIGIGGFCSSLSEGKKSYKEAVKALKFVTKESSLNSLHGFILHSEDMDIENNAVFENHKELFEEEFYSKILKHDEESIRAAFSKVIDKLSIESQMNLELYKQCMVEFFIENGKRWDALNYNIIEKIIKARDEQELWQISKDYIDEVVQKILSGRKGKNFSIIQKANQYMLEHYDKELSLEEIAKEVCLSPYYFSRFYKEESGMNFSDKLAQIRIDKAKELLKNEEFSIKDVSYMVGYTEPNYFSKIFKKATGYTASEYKKSFVQ